MLQESVSLKYPRYDESYPKFNNNKVIKHNIN